MIIFFVFLELQPPFTSTCPQMDALVMMGALDSLHRLFGADARAVAAVRNAGLSALNLAGPIKERIALHAMGGKGAGK